MSEGSKIKYLGMGKKTTRETSSKTTALEKGKTRADYEEDYKRTHIGLIAKFVRDAAGM